MQKAKGGEAEVFFSSMNLSFVSLADGSLLNGGKVKELSNASMTKKFFTKKHTSFLSQTVWVIFSQTSQKNLLKLLKCYKYQSVALLYVGRCVRLYCFIAA